MSKVSIFTIQKKRQPTVLIGSTKARARTISWPLLTDGPGGPHPPELGQRQKPKDFGPSFPADQVGAKAIIQASSAGLDVVTNNKNGTIQFQKQASGSAITICFYDGSGYVPVSVFQNSVVKPPGGERSVGIDNKKTARVCYDQSTQKNAPQYTLHLRSVEEIFYYLGNLVAPDAQNYVLRQFGTYKGCPRIPFFISTMPVDHARFSVSYRGDTYYIGDTSRRIECGDRDGVVDNTMRILAIVNDLLNLSRDASETPTTKAVQAVGGG